MDLNETIIGLFGIDGMESLLKLRAPPKEDQISELVNFVQLANFFQAFEPFFTKELQLEYKMP